MKILGAVTAAAALLAPSLAAAEPKAGGTISLVAHVPVTCWVKPQNGPVRADPGVGGFGEVVEACNSPRGYRVSASYRPLGYGEQARLRYADRLIQLPSHGQTLLRQASLAQVRRVSYQFHDVMLHEPLVLALAIQPL